MHRRREEKHHADFLKTSGQNSGGQADLQGGGSHHGGRAASGAQTAVAVLGHSHPSSRNNKRRCGGNIERAGGAATGATGIYQGISGAAGIRHGVFVNRQRLGRGTHGFGKPHNLFDGLALHMERHKQGRNLRVGSSARKNFGHNRARFFTRERFTVVGDTLQSVNDHGAEL